MVKVGVILSGCGVYDGAEIQETVITMLALDRAGVESVYLAPDIDQLHVINHLTGQEMEGETRNVSIEAARITRGNIRDLAEISAQELDALIFPGGFGVAKNLSDYAMSGAKCDVNPYVKELTTRMHNVGKPIGAICIAPVMLAKILGETVDSLKLTIGTDQKTAADIDIMGAKHVACSVEEIIVDKNQKVVSTPAYMDGKSISEVAAGIEKLVAEVLIMVK
ncbi:isoprenoid biosynthesis glyoxalase ElbB [Candidatus Neomarinimicrobiota bacterium]